MNTPRIAIIGAGLAGLSCARRLRRDYREKLDLTVLEKSRGFGGRCATRRFGEHVVDHGAQYFTAAAEPFEEFLQELPEGERRVLKAPIRDFSGEDFVTPKGERYYLAHGNNTLGRAMAADLQVRHETLVECVETTAQGGISVDGALYDAVVLTAPLPQMARFLNQPEPEGYIPNLTGFFEYNDDPRGPARERYALLDLGGKAGSIAEWSACENQKQGRIAPGKSVFVVQASGSFSREFLENDPEKWLPLLQEELETLWELDSAKRGATFGHRWRFARVEKALEMPFDLPRGMFAAGDFQKKSRVEAAWMTGWTAAERVARYLDLDPARTP